MRARLQIAAAIGLGVVVAYLFAETAATAWYRWSGRRGSLWLFEESSRTIHFDAARGYRLTTEPSRRARITNGQIEYVGVLRGNRQGFPDRDDFSVARPEGVDYRVAVMGDSFTAARNFDAVLRGENSVSLPGEPFRPVLARLVWRLLANHFLPPAFPAGFIPAQEALIAEMRRFREQRGIPAIVVYFPSREDLREGSRAPEAAARRFAALLGAEFWDGTEPFRGQSPEQIRGYFSPTTATGPKRAPTSSPAT